MKILIKRIFKNDAFYFDTNKDLPKIYNTPIDPKSIIKLPSHEGVACNGAYTFVDVELECVDDEGYPL